MLRLISWPPRQGFHYHWPPFSALPAVSTLQRRALSAHAVGLSAIQRNLGVAPADTPKVAVKTVPLIKAEGTTFQQMYGDQS